MVSPSLGGSRYPRVSSAASQLRHYVAWSTLADLIYLEHLVAELEVLALAVRIRHTLPALGRYWIRVACATVIVN
jgi:uncharacterized membrane protein YjfL (UPF0719 family)